MSGAKNMLESFDAGVHTQEEIHSQPRCWAECLDGLKASQQIERIVREASLEKPWLFIGCGSSYYLALAAAASWTALTGAPARAVPASELLLFPHLTLAHASAFQPVLISRSGHTSEILKVGEHLSSKHVPIVAVTCAPGQPLERMAAGALCLSPADEKSMVMTRSFTSMLLGIQFLAAKIAHNAAAISSLERLPGVAQRALDAMDPLMQSLVAGRDFADYVCLGQGPFYGLACEAALKVQEMSCSYSQAFHTMEFRHGPKAIVASETLIVFLLSRSGFEAEREVLEEVKGLGGTTLVVTSDADERIRRASDWLIELHLDGDETSGLAAHSIPGQLLGLYTGLKKGLNPDQPRHLS
ncbi:MAG: SIS domain-containing protein, partial [Candidatus Acidiferrales bacterium]